MFYNIPRFEVITFVYTTTYVEIEEEGTTYLSLMNILTVEAVLHLKTKVPRLYNLLNILCFNT